MTLDEHHEEAVRLILAGHNVLVTGQAGTGKTQLAKHVAKMLGKKTAILCSTGLACLQYSEAYTLHR